MEIEEHKKTNKALQESESKLRDANAAKDKFFSIIAHDLKNPLQTMLLSSSYLASHYQGMSVEELYFYIDGLNKGSHRLASLLENLLNWARSQTGRIDYLPETIVLSDFLNLSIDLLIASADKKGVILFSEIPEDLTVFADPNMIMTVIRNLISNAIKFTPKGGEVKVTSTVNDGFVTVTIADSGIGISKENQLKLFRIDVHHTTLGTSSEEGTGLGLVLCREFVERHAGRIWVESSPGRGSRFNFTLPRTGKP